MENLEIKKSHERVLDHFEKTIDSFAEDILKQNYVTKDDLKVKIRACAINAIKASKKQGTHEAQIITLNEKIRFKSSEYLRIHKELGFVTKLYSTTLSFNKLKEFWEKREIFIKSL